MATVTISVALVLGVGQGSFALEGPCDIYKTGGTPCVAAFSTVRALYGNYTGKLYQVRNASNQTKDIGVLSTGYVANSATQDSFCTGRCTISKIYDQSGNGNDLVKGPAGNTSYGPYPDSEAVATALPIKLDGHKVYGVHVTPGGWTKPGQVGYRVSNPKGTAKGDDPETEYMVTDGTYVNDACCFDFGNAETDPLKYTSMDAIYFGVNNWWDVGAGSGPWIMADLENGVYNHGGATTNRVHLNSNAPSFAYPFVTALLKNNKAGASGGPFTIKGGNAQSGTLTTVWDGARPDGYTSLGKAGGIVLGIGGDNSSGAQGNFYEGIMTTGFASSTTDAAIQANIVAAGYGKTTTGILARTEQKLSQASMSYDAASATARVGYTVEKASQVRIRAVDFQGREVARLVEGEVESGRHEATWNAKQVHSGIYAVVMEVDGAKVWSGNAIIGR
jgi:non-reducing end alpha-L-arabinofuranosidase